jgi:hypothetical protein
MREAHVHSRETDWQGLGSPFFGTVGSGRRLPPGPHRGGRWRSRTQGVREAFSGSIPPRFSPLNSPTRLGMFSPHEKANSYELRLRSRPESATREESGFRTTGWQGNRSRAPAPRHSGRN